MQRGGGSFVVTWHLVVFFLKGARKHLCRFSPTAVNRVLLIEQTVVTGASCCLIGGRTSLLQV